MSMISKDEALELLDKMSFFNQRAGRELWMDKSKEVQDEDIKNRERDIALLKQYIGQSTGNWIYHNRFQFGKSYHECSVCHATQDGSYGSSCCPECGARLDN